MVAVRVMKAPVHQIIDMVAMGHRLVAAAGAVTVFSIVAGGVVFGIAAIRIHVAYRDRMLMRPTVLAVFKTAVVEIIHVTFMPHGDVTAAWTVHMRGTFAGRLGGGWHCNVLSPLGANQIAPGGDSGENTASGSLKESLLERAARAAFQRPVIFPSARSRRAAPLWASPSRTLSNCQPRSPATVPQAVVAEKSPGCRIVRPVARLAAGGARRRGRPGTRPGRVIVDRPAS